MEERDVSTYLTFMYGTWHIWARPSRYRKGPNGRMEQLQRYLEVVDLDRQDQIFGNVAVN